MPRREIALLLLANVAATLGVWAFSILVPPGESVAPGLTLIERYMDGPSFVAVAASLYDPAHPVWAAYGDRFGIAELSASHHATVLPLHPLAIRLLAPVFGWFGALLVLALVWGSLATLAVYRFLRECGQVTVPFAAALAFTVVPPRWLVYHSVGANDPAFVLFVVLAITAFRRDHLGWSGLWGGLAAATRIQGVLLFPALLAAALLRDRRRAGRSLLLLSPILLALAAVFALYAWRLDDPWAYFAANAGELTVVPFRGLFRSATGGTPAAAFGPVLLYAIAAYGIGWWARRGEWGVALPCLALTVLAAFTTLPDVGRFLLAAMPFLLFAPFDAAWSRPEARWAVIATLPAVYAYTWACLWDNALAIPVFESLKAALP